MEIKQLENLSELSKLAFDESEANQMMSDLDKLVEMVSVVKDADVDGTFKIKTIDMEDLRDDVVVESNARFRLENLVQVVLVYVKACGNAQNADLSEIFFNISQCLVRPAFGDGAFSVASLFAKLAAGKGEDLKKL